MSLHANDDGAYAQPKKIVRALGGQWLGNYGMACCPAHQDRTPSLSVTQKNGRLLFYCHAGCSQGDVISALRSTGLWLGRGHAKREISLSTVGEEEQSRHSAFAREVWEKSVRVEGTGGETYLDFRGLPIPATDALRFNNGLKHPSGDVWPALVALVTRGYDGLPLGIHRTFLARDGSGKAPVDPSKMMLGPCSGGAVRFADPGDMLMVGEGIETTLSAMKATKWPAWAALSTSGLRNLELPPEVRDVIILADGDEPGEAAALHAKYRWRRQGRHVRIARPPRGSDFNDVLCGIAR